MNKHPVSVVKTLDTNRIGLILVFHEKKKVRKKRPQKINQFKVEWDYEQFREYLRVL